MKKRVLMLPVLVSVIVSTSCSKQDMKTLTIDQMQDKIAGGWAGKMIGVAYGAPTEFRARGETYEKDLQWDPSFVAGSLRQDDIYVQLSRGTLQRAPTCGMLTYRHERIILTALCRPHPAVRNIICMLMILIFRSRQTT